MVKRYSKTFKDEAVRKHEGASVKEVAAQTGASVFSLRDWLKAQEQAERERPATQEELSEIRRLKRVWRSLKRRRSF